MKEYNAAQHKYGIPLTCRLDPHSAAEVTKGAHRLGISMNKYLFIVISKGLATTSENERHTAELEKLRSEYQNAMASFIKWVADGNQDKEFEYIEKLNVIKSQEHGPAIIG